MRCNLLTQRYINNYCVIILEVFVENLLKMSLPILFVLKPEAVSISDAFKLVKDYGWENWSRTIKSLQQSSREEFQFWDVPIIQLCNIVK